MATIEFESSELGPAAVAEADTGGPLIDVCDEAHAPVAFSCRLASCGTCRVDVLEGISCFEPASQEELEVLDVFGAPPTQRLACQARLKPGRGRVRLKWVGD